MVKCDVMENFPLQLISRADVQQILDDACDTPPCGRPAAAEEWGRLSGHVRQAVADAYLRGVVARDGWLARLAGEWQRIEAELAEEDTAELRAAYIQLLDRIYGATYRHVLRRVPTAVLCGTGHFHLSRLLFYRHARVRDAEKPALQEVLELFYEGSDLRLELEFSWEPMGEQPGSESPWRRRMNE